jgi:GT2 family glycosyltransferase
VAIDELLLRLWRDAPGKSLDDLRAGAHPDLAGTLAEALACLAEAGLLDRTPAFPRAEPILQPLGRQHSVTAVIVISVPGELVWLEECVRSLSVQHHPVDDVVVVDNASTCDIGPWLIERGLPARVIPLKVQTTFAGALNAGVEAGAPSEFIFLLNTDVSIHPAAVQNLIARALKDPRCASVAPKLMLWRTPAFLNGLGNRVPNVAWGVDNGIGQLDLGQLDHWTHVPSSCFGAVMITRTAWDDVGPCDASYPGYYEDTDWTYRARVLGYRHAAGIDAIVRHVYGVAWTPAGTTGLAPKKLRNAVIGRMRFCTKIPRPRHALRMMRQCLHESRLNVRDALRDGDRRTLGAYVRATAGTLWATPGVLRHRRRLQRRRVTPDAEIFNAEGQTPAMMWENVPELTSKQVREYYAPLMREGRTRPIPELAPERRPQPAAGVAKSV